MQHISTAPQGHVYLDVIDPEDSGMKAKARLWKSQGAARFRTEVAARGEDLRKGEKVFILVRPELHPRYGFSLIVTDIAFADSLGPAERKLREALQRLSFEGMKDKNRGLTDPTVVFRVALIAPHNSEGQHDFLKIVESQRTRAPIYVQKFTATFQSENAPLEIVAQIGRAIDWNPDVIVVVRGGGSKADLLYLNTYEIGLAICSCPLPCGLGSDILLTER